MSLSTEQAVKTLEQQGFVCLKPYEKPTQYKKIPKDKKLFLGKIIDTETTGLHEDAKIFEIGCVLFHYDADGILYDVVDSFTMFEDPHEPLEQDIITITGRTDKDLKGKVFDEEQIQQIIEQPGIVIAHNASFDRPLLEKRFSIFEQCGWGCSQQDIPWLKLGYIDSKLRLLAQDIGKFHFYGHKAENDCLATLEILSHTILNKKKTWFQLLLEKAKTVSTRLYAIDSKFEKKGLLQAKGFKWSTMKPKAYYIDCPSIEKLDEIKTWLQDTIYDYSLDKDMLGYAQINARNRYSKRIHCSNTYRRHTMPFGQHKDKPLKSIVPKEKRYFTWLLGDSTNLDQDLRTTIQFYL